MLLSKVLSLVFGAAVAFASAPKFSSQMHGGALNIQAELKDVPLPAGVPVAPHGLPIIEGYYKQTVDHFGNQQGVNGTWFNQLYYVQDQYYKPGGPVFFFISGESAASPGWMQGGLGSILSWLMPRYGGMAVTLEHRFYGAGADPTFPGRSVPTSDLSPESLQLLTANQAIEDMAQFISDFPSLFPHYNLTERTKWITIGGSYPGSLSAWMIQQHPELIHAAHAASAPVQLQEDFWRYSYAVDQGMNFEADLLYKTGNACMNGWTRAVHLFDSFISANQNNPAALQAFKSKFWLSQVNNVGDFASIVTSMMGGTVQYDPSNTMVGSDTLLSLICGGKKFPAFVNPHATDADLLTALQGLTILQLQAAGIQGDADPSLATYNTLPTTDFSLTGPMVGSLWGYQACNEFGYSQVAQPLNNGLIESWSVYSQNNNISYAEWSCNIQGLSKNANSAAINAQNQYFGGLWNYQSNILWVNGQYDPWHWLSNYESAPGADQVSLLYKNATHCNDLWGPLKVPTKQAGYWPPTTISYEATFFDEIFATLKDVPLPAGVPVAPHGLPIIEGYYKQTVAHFGNQQGINGTWFNQLYYIRDRYYKPDFMKLASIPTADLSPESLKLLTANQAIEDMSQFISNFPSLCPHYNLTKRTNAPVQLHENFWQYSFAIDQGMKFEANLFYGTGKACMNGWTRAVYLFDSFIAANQNNRAALQAFKSKFWLRQVNNIGDFASIVTSIMGGTVLYDPSNTMVGRLSMDANSAPIDAENAPGSMNPTFCGMRRTVTICAWWGPLKGPSKNAGYWPPTTISYQTTFFDEIFAIYDKWLL
ncbi:Thymus-specific serine protease [Podochytrium sp. JEL0797]|nr:Thymus-specific serine protease [Podochytrium sp. JEL0797]